MGDKYKLGHGQNGFGDLKKGLLRFVERGGIRYATITEKGRRALRSN